MGRFQKFTKTIDEHVKFLKESFIKMHTLEKND